jgi:CubicO group peptidase (beta-lactamase class C family)
MTTTASFAGKTDARFRSVEEAFRDNFDRCGEVGASLCVYMDGTPVVDIWGGFADAARTRPWERDTIVNVWSTTKGITAACAHMLVQEGRLDIDAPVAKYWPEFAQAGKESLPVRMLLNHQAGLAAISEPLPPGSAYKWDVMTDALVRQAPWWEPGTQTGYHALTYGWLVGEVIRRITGKSVGQYFREEFAQPLGLDFQIGLPASEDVRVAEIIPAEPDPNNYMFQQAMNNLESIQAKLAFNPPDLLGPGIVNTREWRAAEIPAGNGHGNGRSVAAFYGALATGKVLTPETIAAATVEQFDGIDCVLGIEARVGLGFILPSSRYPMGAGKRNFGHSGAGGSIGFADPDAGLGFGYAMNRMLNGLDGTLEDPRWRPLMDAVYAAL